jgi:hypothetical protein
LGRSARLAAASSPVIQFGLTVGYTALTLEWLRAPEGALARLLRPWRELVARGLGPVLNELGSPPCRSLSAKAEFLYREYVQLILVEAGLAVLCYVACASLWRGWAGALRRYPRWAGADATRIESELEIGQGLALAGLLGAAWFLVGAPYPAANCLRPDPWLFLRPPLVITTAYGLACFATAFGLARLSKRQASPRTSPAQA